jgi:hypothetical protein
MESNVDDHSYKGRRDGVAWAGKGKRRMGEKHVGKGGAGGLSKAAEVGAGEQALFG